MKDKIYSLLCPFLDWKITFKPKKVRNGHEQMKHCPNLSVLLSLVLTNTYVVNTIILEQIW